MAKIDLAIFQRDTKPRELKKVVALIRTAKAALDEIEKSARTVNADATRLNDECHKLREVLSSLREELYLSV